MPEPTTEMEKQVLRDKNAFSDKKGGGYSSKGSKELPLGENGFLKSGQQDIMPGTEKGSEETIRKPEQDNDTA